MSYTHPLSSNLNAASLRRDAGRYIRHAREKAGLTQQQVAKALGMDYYTMISQIELGKGRVPPDKLQRWADVLRCDRREFGKKLLSYYDPYMWHLLFGSEVEPE